MLTIFTRVCLTKGLFKSVSPLGWARQWIAIALLLMSHTGFSQQQDQPSTEDSHWTVGVAFGLGLKTNPLIDSDPIPQVILFDIAYYGDKTYFDNGELGYRWIDNDKWLFSSYVSLDRERALFYFWDPANILINTTAGDVASPIDPIPGGENPAPIDSELSLSDIKKPSWAVLGGSRIDYFVNEQRFSLLLEGDVSNTHQGYLAQLSYQKIWRQQDWQFYARTFLRYKSARYIDYYYGVDEQDNVPESLFYTGKHGVEFGASLIYSYNLSEHWQFISSTSFKTLPSGMTDSPIVNKQQQYSLFVGFGYRF